MVLLPAPLPKLLCFFLLTNVPKTSPIIKPLNLLSGLPGMSPIYDACTLTNCPFYTFSSLKLLPSLKLFPNNQFQERSQCAAHAHCRQTVLLYIPFPKALPLDPLLFFQGRSQRVAHAHGLTSSLYYLFYK